MEIKSRFDHFNFNVLNLEKSIEFLKNPRTDSGKRMAKFINRTKGSFDQMIPNLVKSWKENRLVTLSHTLDKLELKL